MQGIFHLFLFFRAYFIRYYFIITFFTNYRIFLPANQRTLEMFMKEKKMQQEVSAREQNIFSLSAVRLSIRVCFLLDFCLKLNKDCKSMASERAI